MLAKLLLQLDRILKKNMSLSSPGSPICKSVSTTCEYLEDDSKVEHTHADDIEALFYVFVWIIIQYDGPFRHKCQLNVNDSTLLDHWSRLREAGVAGAADAKMAFLISHAREDDLREQISPYFKDLFNLALDWRKAVAKNLNKDQAVTFSDILPIFDAFLANMPCNDKPPEMTTILRDLKCDYSFIANLKLPPIISESVITSPPLMSPKCLSEDIRSMGNPPHPNKQFRHV